MRLIDTHTHLYVNEFEIDIAEVIRRAEDTGVEKFYLPAIDSETHRAMLELEARFPKCIAMMGLHPVSVKENFEDELQIVEEWLARRKFVAIGEIGLDFHWDKTFIPQQQEAFKRQMGLALKYNVPIVIHTRSAMQETIEAVRPFAAKGLTGIFHCFGESYEFAKQVIDLGFYLGIGGVLTYKKSGLDETLKQVPLEYLVLETDSPYLTPVPFRGKRNESSYLQHVLKKLAEVKGVTEDVVAAITTANAEKIFGG
jgi:TatD DNase family protein